MKNKTLIIGSSGLLGSKLKKHFEKCLCPNILELDIRQEIKKSKFYKENKSKLKNIKQVIHCAALKNVDFCDNNRVEALKTNVLGTINVALFCNEIKAKLIYISTDYVFRGDKGNYKPNDEVGRINFYGETKLASEIITKSIHDHLIIIRLSFCEDFFPYEKAYCNQISTKIIVSEAAQRIYDLVKSGYTGIKHLPGKKQSVYNFAKKTNKNVKKMLLENKNPPYRPLIINLLEENDQ